MKFIELFAGIGGFRYGLENTTRYISCHKKGMKGKLNAKTQLGLDSNKGLCHENSQQKETIRNKEGQSCKLNNQFPRRFTCVWANEIDKYACQVYRKNFGEGELHEGDITKIKATDIPEHDLLTAGFPCQAFSIAGKHRGFDDTRGTLFFEIARICRAKKPSYILLENVKGLLNHQSGQTFQTILKVLTNIGYILQWEVLNSKNFGVPQNRERVFLIGYLRGASRPEVFPIGAKDTKNVQQSSEKQKRRSWVSTLDSRYGERWSTETYVRPNKPNTQKRGDQPHSANSIRRTSYTNDMRIRRLTPKECERLQGFPDGWTEGISDTQRYKCLGNAVTTNVITEIGRRLRR